jgi:hypothetical protein
MTCAPNSLPKRVILQRLVTGILLLAIWYGCSGSAYSQDHACKVIPAGQESWIRLTEPVATYSSKVGDAVHAILIESPLCGKVAAFSTGIAVEGRITSVRRVGMGFWHESSAVQIEFDRIFADAEPLSVNTRVEEIANARESVKGGVIAGVRSTDTPQKLFTLRLIHLPDWNPESYWIFLVRRAVFPFSPEPEIYLPPGTDLRLKLMAPLRLPDGFVSAPSANARVNGVIDTELREKILSLPSRSLTKKGRRSDIVNLAFIGSAQQLESAFHAAGWADSDSVSAWSVLREMRALTSLNSYSQLPVSNQWLDGNTADLTLQKSFDSYEKREHIRIWNEDSRESNLWASGVIRETGAVWSIRTRRFIHHVDANLDAEREKVVRELTLTGCVAGVYRIPRAEKLDRLKNATGDVLRTDGSIAVIEMKDCEAPPLPAIQAGFMLASRPKSKLARFVRKQALSIHDLWRSNMIYASFDLSRTVIQALHDRHVRLREAQEEREVEEEREAQQQKTMPEPVPTS